MSLDLIYHFIKKENFKNEYFLFLSIIIASLFSCICFILSTLKKNYSYVDKLWSILPVFYSWLFTLFPNLFLNEAINFRSFLSSILVSMWGVRLTYNFYRKGGYKLEAEDYRWGYLKKMLSPIQFHILNFFFISFYQNYLLLSIILPGYVMFINRNNNFIFFDLIPTSLYFIFLLGEYLADEQQWQFQENKKICLKNKINNNKNEFAIGFRITGLFKYSRHPNFFCEIMIWWSYYLFSATSSGNIFNFSIIGAFLLNLLFLGSTTFTESITEKKYPMYKIYQQEVNRIVPWFSSKTFNYEILFPTKKLI